MLLKGDGTPAKVITTNFAIKDSKILGFIRGSTPKNDEDGSATVTVQAKERGQTIVTVKVTIKEKLIQDDIVIAVT